MLGLINSYYITKIVFSYANEGQKLKIVKYTKNLQKDLDITILNYKLYKGKYIIYETKRNGKEYNKYDKLVFEGEYLNGERNGKGKEYYYNGNIEFEGEYKNGKRIGKGKEYYDNGKIKFDGEFLYGKRNGKGKEYYKDQIKFEGEYKNGKVLSGIKYDDNGNIVQKYNNINGNGEENDFYNFRLMIQIWLKRKMGKRKNIMEKAN